MYKKLVLITALTAVGGCSNDGKSSDAVVNIALCFM